MGEPWALEARKPLIGHKVSECYLRLLDRVPGDIRVMLVPGARNVQPWPLICVAITSSSDGCGGSLKDEPLRMLPHTSGEAC